MLKELTVTFTVAASVFLTPLAQAAPPSAPTKSPRFSTNPVPPPSSIPQRIFPASHIAIEEKTNVISQTSGTDLNLTQVAPRDIIYKSAKFEKSNLGFSITVDVTKSSGRYHAALLVYDFNGAAKNENVPVFEQQKLGTPKVSFFEENGIQKMKFEYSAPATVSNAIDRSQGLAIVPTPVGPLITPSQP
jgi:hypothetical protein